MLETLRQIQQTQAQLLTAVESLTGKVDVEGSQHNATSLLASGPRVQDDKSTENDEPQPVVPISGSRSGFTSRIVLT